MKDKPHLPRDENPRDQDKPIDVDNAADHRPDDAGGPDPTSPPEGRDGHQNEDAKLPDPSLIQKQQRSQGMNHSGWEGKN